MFEKEAVEYVERTKTEKEIEVLNTVHDWGQESLSPNERRLFEGIQDRKEAREQGFKEGAEFGFNKAKEEMQVQKYSVSYENGIFKCKYKSGKEFESVDGKTWKEIVLPKEIE